jgi:hypothetical protein
MSVVTHSITECPGAICRVVWGRISCQRAWSVTIVQALATWRVLTTNATEGSLMK